MTHPVEMPEEFRRLIQEIDDPKLAKVAAHLDLDIAEYFLDYSVTDLKEQKRLGAYLEYILTHKDARDRSSALWRDLDAVGQFRGVTQELRFFAKVRDLIRKGRDGGQSRSGAPSGKKAR